MYTTGEIAAELCLETPGLDTLDIAVFWGGSPTIASTQTILVNAAHGRARTTWSRTSTCRGIADAGLYQLVIPGQHELALALPWGGTSHPVWFKRDPRVANVKVLGGVFNRALMRASRRSSRPPSRRPRTCRPTSGTPRWPRPPRR